MRQDLRRPARDKRDPHRIPCSEHPDPEDDLAAGHETLREFRRDPDRVHQCHRALQFKTHEARAEETREEFRLEKSRNRGAEETRIGKPPGDRGHQTLIEPRESADQPLSQLDHAAEYPARDLAEPRHDPLEKPAQSGQKIPRKKPGKKTAEPGQDRADPRNNASDDRRDRRDHRAHDRHDRVNDRQDDRDQEEKCPADGHLLGGGQDLVLGT